ncbi:HTH domain-containing protein [Limnohabitans sp. T6-20]|uniref:HTH domain-containing protein n=1 Tax=Limnohabitans sp. T6-20 TaxID=1100725 RepID=UPI0018EE8F38|nr:HTH domain-containing protein [Limnohabitans sp. T6-20]
MSLTFLQLAEKVLAEQNRALSVDEIWQLALSADYVAQLNSTGKTPIHTLGSKLYGACKPGVESNFVSIGNRPKRFYLRSMETTVDTESIEEPPDEPVSLELKPLLEKELHPLMAYFAQSEFQAYCKTINHQKSSKSTYAQWTHPDMVGCFFPDMEPAARELSKALGSPKLRLYSFELKRHLTFQNLRESFFQAVSNSSWANEGYLCASKISADLDFRSELQRLSNSFGIGVIEFDLNDPDSTAILYQAKEHELDWNAINKLCEINTDFEVFLHRVRADLNNNEPRVEKYDRVETAEKIKEMLATAGKQS